MSDCYLPRLGGIEMQVRDLSAHQIAGGDQVQVLTSTPAGSGSGGSGGPGAAHVPVHRVSNSTGDFPSARGVEQLRELIETGGFDVIHAHSSIFSPLAWMSVRSAVSAGIPAVVTMHSLLPARGWPVNLSDGVLGWSAWPVQWTAVSSAAAAPLRPMLGHDQVMVLPNGIDPAAWKARAPRRPGGTLTLVSVMRLSRRKCPHALLGILASVRRLLPRSLDLQAFIVGDGPQRRSMERRIRLLGMSSWVTLTGILTRTEVREVLIESDVYLAPARRESFGLAALEARCAGLPVVAMSSGGVSEFIRHGREGFLVGSDAEMARATATLLTSPQLRSMQEHNRLSAPDLSWPLVLTRAQDLYQRAGAPAERQFSTVNTSINV